MAHLNWKLSQPALFFASCRALTLLRLWVAATRARPSREHPSRTRSSATSRTVACRWILRSGYGIRRWTAQRGSTNRTTIQRRHDAGLSSTDNAPAHFACLVCFQRLLLWSIELHRLIDDGQPEGGNAVVEVARTMTVTLDDGLWSELLQTRTRRHKVLPKATGIVGRVHYVAIAKPQFLPSCGTIRYRHGLTVECHDTCVRFTNAAARDVALDLVGWDGGHRHGHGFGRRQPDRIVIVCGVVADIVDITEHERHRAEAP
uniref:Putative secreted protein n=1 Tax=Anopheles darlingi TaxID=43151 RepID=A0A2M4DPX6_ANODA